MSCRRRTTVLRIPASALGMKTRREWENFLREHEDDLDGEPGHFGESLSESRPWSPSRPEADLPGPLDRLDSRDPACPDVVPGPFLDYCLEEILPLPPEQDRWGEKNTARPLKKKEAERYLPLFKALFPRFTLKDMEYVRWCRYEWYDGSDAPYLYSDTE